ncbi:MAG: PAS domain-containing protein, partial [Myxococcota bacterium]
MTSILDLHPEDLELFTTLSLDLLAIAQTDRLCWVSPRWTEVLGWSADELVSQPYLAFVHPDDVANTVAEAERLGSGAQNAQFLNRYRTKGGRYRWLEWNTSVAESGRLYCIVRDVTTRIESRQKLRQRAKLVEMSQQLLQVGHWYMDRLRNTTFWSPEVYVIHGQDPTTFTPSPERTLLAFHRADRAMVADAVGRAFDLGDPFELEARVVRPTGEVRLVKTMGQAQRLPTGEISGVFGILRDITDDERVKRNQELEQFAYVATHDLRQPVRTIRQYLALIDEDYELGLDDEGRTFWGFVTQAADRLDQLVRDLGRYTRAGGAASPTVVELHDVVRVAVETATPGFEAREGG